MNLVQLLMLREQVRFIYIYNDLFVYMHTPRLDKDARVARCPECNPDSMSSTSITVWLEPARDSAPMIGVLQASDKLLPSSVT